MRRLSLPLLVLASLAVLLTASTQDSEQDRRAIGQALAAYQAGDLMTAVKGLRDIHRRRPEDPEVRLYLGLILYEQNNACQEARGLLESVADRYAGNKELQVKLLDSYLAAGETSEALGRLQGLQETLDKDDRYAFQIIYLLVRYGLSDPALEQLNRVSARVSQAVKGLQESDRTSPANKPLIQKAGEVFFIRGLIAAGADRKAEAMELLQRADRHDFPPRDSYQMVILADCLARLKELKLAAQAYEEYLKHHPEDDAARMRMGDSYYALAWFEEARGCYEAVRKRNPGFPMADYSLGKVLLDLKETDEAERYIRDSLKSDPACARCIAKLAHIEYLRGHAEECAALLDKAAALDPEWTETHLVFGLLYNRLGKYDLAVRSLEKAIQGDPEYPTAHFQIALAYQRLGNAEKAREHREIYNRLLAAKKP